MTFKKINSPILTRLAQLVVIISVLLSFSVEMASALINAESSTFIFEEIGSESDSEGEVDYEIEKEKSPIRDHTLSFDWSSYEVCLQAATNLGLSNAKSPLQQLVAPPPQV